MTLWRACLLLLCMVAAVSGRRTYKPELIVVNDNQDEAVAEPPKAVANFDLFQRFNDYSKYMGGSGQQHQYWPGKGMQSFMSPTALATVNRTRDERIPVQHPRRRPRLAKQPIHGNMFVTYTTIITIDGQQFEVVLDTGSGDIAVAASEKCGCPVWYQGHCEGLPLRVEYGDQGEYNTFWAGTACKDQVILRDLDLGRIWFAGITDQKEMFDCSKTRNQTGIIGLGYRALLGPPSNYTDPFMDIVHTKTGMPKVFAFQSCGWIPTMPETQPEARGNWDLGGVNSHHFTGPIVWTPILERAFYAVDMVDLLIDDISVFPAYRRPARTFGDQGRHPERHRLPVVPQTIVDSGTSDIVFPPEVFDVMLAVLKIKSPSISDKVWSGEECIQHGDNLSMLFPTITIVLAGTGSKAPFGLVLPPCRYMVQAPHDQCDGKPGHIFSIDRIADVGIILGQPVFQSYYIVHDQDNDRVGFATMTGCKHFDYCPAMPVIDLDGFKPSSTMQDLANNGADAGLTPPQSHPHKHHHEQQDVNDDTDANNNEYQGDPVAFNRPLSERNSMIPQQTQLAETDLAPASPPCDTSGYKLSIYSLVAIMLVIMVCEIPIAYFLAHYYSRTKFSKLFDSRDSGEVQPLREQDKAIQPANYSSLAAQPK